MRPTRLGVFTAGLAAFSLFAAGSTGNNLLYMLFAAVVVALVLDAAAGALNLRSLSARLEAPERIFRGAPFSARVVAENPGRWTARVLFAAGPLGRAALGDAAPGGRASGDLRLVLEARGRNLLDGLYLESLYPFGFFLARRRLPPAELLALPAAGPASGPEPEPETDARARGEGSRRRAREGDFFGPRPYAPDDDARAIHWKLTAKTGQPVVAEYASAPRGRTVVRLQGTSEAEVERAAAACRRRIEAGDETGLVGPGVEVRPGRGLGHLDELLKALALVGDGGAPRPVAAAAPPRDAGAEDTRALRRLTLALGVVVYLGLFLIDEMSARWLLVCAPLLPLGWLLQERGGPFPPSWAWNALSAAMLVFLVAFDWRVSGVALANAHLLSYLLINRLLSPWPRRELRQAVLILFLAFFLVSGLTISPWYFPLFVAWTALAGAWLMVQAGARPERPRAWAPALGRLLAAGAALGVLVFVAVPRVEGLRRFNPFVASGMDKLQVRSQAVMGFTDRVTLGHFGELLRSSARVMRVRPAHPPADGEDAPPLYVRGAAFDDFDGRVWTKTPLDFRWREKGERRATVKGRAWARSLGGDAWAFPGTPDLKTHYDFEVYPMRVPVLFTVGPPARIDGIAAPPWFDHTDAVRAPDALSGGARYREFPAARGAEPTAAAADLRARALARALRVPADPGGRQAALAERWTRGRRTAAAKAAAVVGQLEGRYAYSLGADGGDADLDGFLFDSRAGNCEYFATAAAILLRRVGVPTRLVTGFHADDWNRWGRFYDVRQSQAHAWIEAWLPGRGWTRYDPTPAESGLSAAASAFTRRLGRVFDLLQARWYRSVIGYDQYAQRNTFLRLTMALAFERVRSFVERAVKIVLPLALGLGLAGWAFRLLLAALRRGDEYERAERALARAGLRREEWQTPREFARAVAARRPELGAVETLAEAHYRRRYAGAAPAPDERRRASAALAELRSRL